MLVWFRPSEVAISYLGMKTCTFTKLRKVLATHRCTKVGGEFENCRQSVQSFLQTVCCTDFLIKEMICDTASAYLLCHIHIFVMPHPYICYATSTYLLCHIHIFVMPHPHICYATSTYLLCHIHIFVMPHPYICYATSKYLLCHIHIFVMPHPHICYATSTYLLCHIRIFVMPHPHICYATSSTHSLCSLCSSNWIVNSVLFLLSLPNCNLVIKRCNCQSISATVKVQSVLNI
jgi:hypothetical protein